MTPVIFDPIYVQFGTLKQNLRSWRTSDDVNFLVNLGVCPDDCVQIGDLGEAPEDGGLIVGLTVERLKRAVKFGIPHLATATRNGVPLGDDDLVVPGDVIEFVRRRASGASRRVKRSKTASLRGQSDTDQTDEPAEAVQDFVFAFDAVRRQWHVRFRYGQKPEEVEQDWLQDCKSMRYIAYLLERPTEQILCKKIFPPLAAEPPKKRRHNNAIFDSTGIGSEEAPESAEDQQSDQESRTAVWKAAKQTQDEWQQQMSQVAAEIKEAREADDEQTAVERENTFAFLEQQYNAQFNKYGRERTFVDHADQSAANRIRNGIGRVLEKCIDGSPRKKYALNRFAEHLETLDYNGGYVRYVDSKRWHVVYPPDVR